MSHKPTDEQATVIDAFVDGQSLVTVAVAGAGKTSTIRMSAEAAPTRRCLYVAYNKALADEAKTSMPRNVEARTAHSLAFRDVGYRYKHRLDAPRLTARQSAEIMYAGGSIPATRVLNAPVDLGGVVLRPAALARTALATVNRYCESADPEIAAHHVPKVEGVTGHARKALVDVVLPIADLAWSDLRHPSGKLRHVPDHYLKVWALGSPYIPADCILFDEAQDANPVLASVLTGQRGAQLVAVGDPCQQLYAWRGSIDALATWPADVRLTLSQSFRFGPRIAARANQWLGLLNAETRVIGAPWIESVIGPIEQPDAVLCRTNAGAMRETMEHLAAGSRVHLTGGGSEIRRLAEAAEKLIHGEPTDHPELAAFASWDEVCQYVAEDDGGDLAPAVKLINDYGPDAIMATCDRLTRRADDAQVVISTGHKSKGLQWPRVHIGDDFREPTPVPYPTPESPRKALVLRKSELMLAYVAVTRAQQQLDDDGVAWVDRVHSYGVPVVVVGERRDEQEPEPLVVKHHPPHSILPDAPDPLDPVWPLSAAEIEDAEQAGLVVRPESPANGLDDLMLDELTGPTPAPGVRPTGPDGVPLSPTCLRCGLPPADCTDILPMLWHAAAGRPAPELVGADRG
ncbi:UvrD-like helicase family protein [Micromonospora sp. M71_S20]|uniref:UvrD-helicase domain-containing protein n=1 Tax=Micromonospora sp. M71_S20 TaxID=592872 RepID=UPI000EB09113|nr:UvrD-helicase domain-containing protein [Micromonospora sp. M71_S20]RLK13296.1 UvrD-like helicase family protein [Micromonospora sp. M71_S20]